MTLVPVLMRLLIRGRIIAEARNPINRVLIGIYRPVIRWVLRSPVVAVLAALVVVGITLWPASQLGSEFMPTLNEGTLMFMPVTRPGLSVTKAGEILQIQDRIIKSFPEVASVFGKAGRADTATDPAPLEMSETIVTLKPPGTWPAGMTIDRLIADMNAALQLPGVSNAWTMPIKARIDMLSTGIRTPVGVKLFGPDLKVLDTLAARVVHVVHGVRGTTGAFAERTEGGHYVDIVPNRQEAARYGISVDDIQNIVAGALGGETVTTTIEGRERYGVTVRYPRALRDDPQAIAGQILVATPGGAMVPLGDVASVDVTEGPPSIRTEDAQPVAYVYVDLAGRDLGGYVAEAARLVARQVTLPPGYRIEWSGQFEYLQRAAARMRVVIPATLAIILVLLFVNFGRLTETFIVMLSVPIMAGLLPILWSRGTGSEIMRRIAVPMVGGMVTSTILTLLVIPAIYAIAKGWRLAPDRLRPTRKHRSPAGGGHSRN